MKVIYMKYTCGFENKLALGEQTLAVFTAKDFLLFSKRKREEKKKTEMRKNH